MTHRLNLFLLILAALVGLPFYWLLLANPPRDVAPHPVSMAQLRQLAASRPGPRPTGVEMLYIGWKRVPGNLYAAGSGMKRRQFGVLAFRLPVPGSGGVVIDGGTTPWLGAAMELEAVMLPRQAEVERWLGNAAIILATSERPQHLGGIALFAGRRDAAAALSHARLNRWQVPGETIDDHIPWPASLVLRPAIPGTRPVAVAPGVVVIPTSSPMPGSQMIYARLADGREYIFAGDVASFAANLTDLRVRSNLLDRGAARPQRAEIMRWLVTLRSLKRQAPGLIVVPGHDIDWVTDPSQHSGVLPVVSQEELQKPAGI